MKQITESQSEEQRTNINEEMRIRVSSIKKHEAGHQRQMLNEEITERIVILREYQRVTVRRNYNLKLAAFHNDSRIKYNEHPNIVIGKMDMACKYCSVKKLKDKIVDMCRMKR